MAKNFKISKLDWVLITSTVLLILFGLIAIYSSNYGGSGTGSSIFLKQLMWFVLGLFVMAVMIFIPSRAFFDFAYFIYALALLMLVLVLFLGGGRGTEERWIRLFGFTIQPSEFAKIAVVIALSRYLSLSKLGQNKVKDLIIAFILIAIPLYLVKEQPDLGTSLVFLVLLIPMLFWAGIQPFTLFVLISPFVSVISNIHFFFFFAWMLVMIGFLYFSKRPLLVIAGIFIINIAAGISSQYIWDHLKPYQKSRLLILLDPQKDARGKGYQVLQSQNAIGSGGISGKGFLKGTQTQLKFLPEQSTDFIFSVFGEEFGFIGIALALSFFFILLYRMINIAVNAREKYEGLIVIGFVSIIVFHVFVNTGMTVGIMPVTGLPLPFLSYGGSFLLTCMIMIGISLNIAYKR
ncbi:rod shape-determining protein RodA [candidate division KSB1 bacterium]